MLIAGAEQGLKQRLQKTLSRIPNLQNQVNGALIFDFYEFLKSDGTSETFHDNYLKTIIQFADFVEKTYPNLTFFDFDDNRKDLILRFLQTKVKPVEEDPERRSFRTYNDYLDRIKFFFRWMHNVRRKQSPKDQIPKDQWETPFFVQLKHLKQKLLSPYSVTQKWTLEEFMLASSKESDIERRAAFRMLWDLDARPHEVLLIKRKNIRFQEKYAEGEIPDGKTGPGGFVLTNSFWDVATWYNEHPFKHPEVPLICDSTGQALQPETLRKWLYELRDKITKMLQNGSIKDQQEASKLKHFVEEKKWNPYCLRHSAITHDSDYLPEYAVKKKARWSMNSKQSSRYISNTLSLQLKSQILTQAGIITDEKLAKPTTLNCPKCRAANPPHYDQCSKCAYPLHYEAYLQTKEKEQSLEKWVDILRKGMRANTDFNKMVMRKLEQSDLTVQMLARRLAKHDPEFKRKLEQIHRHNTQLS